MALPILLAGPIVRRVEPRLVTVWVATSEAGTVKLDLWQGLVSAGTSERPLASGSRAALRIGAALHIAVVTAEIEAPLAPLSPGTPYAYNITVGAKDLAALGLLADTPQQPALGYQPGRLPSFATCPLSIEDLQLMHGSCNRLHADGTNVFFVVDDLIADAGDDPLKRPHQLFLTGDQVYSDDIAIALLPKVNELARELIGARENLQLGKDKVPVAVHQHNLPAGYRKNILTGPGTDQDLEQDPDPDTPVGLTSGDSRCHALGLGERCALHLLHWAPEPWQATLTATSATVTLDDPAALLKDERHPLHERDLDDPPPTLPIATFNAATAWLKKHLTRLDGQLEELREEAEIEHEHVLDYFNRVGRVRRALANVPTYMMFDDHDVTDDWNLCAKWVRDVHATPLGRSVLRDGLVAFLLMQAWGNNPKVYESGREAELLGAAARLFADGAADGPDAAAVQEIETLLGIGTGQPPKVDWHFSIDGAVHRVIVCDTRTRRGFSGDISPPIALPDGIREQQIPEGPLPAGMEMLFVVIGQPVLDSVLLGEFTQGAVNRFLAAKSHIHRLVARTGNLINDPRSADKALPPVDPPIYPLHKKDYEGWSTRPDEIEKLLARLATYKRVAILSGDVHHAVTNSLRYWVRQPTTAGEMLLVSEIAQLTCSAIQLAESFGLVAAATGLQWLDTLTGFGYPVQRLGWFDPPETPVSSPTLPHSGLRRRLLQRPISVPTDGWPEGAEVVLPPDWAWSMDQVTDVRPDLERPESVRIKVLATDFPEVVNPAAHDRAPLTDPNGYAAVARRHAAAMRSRNQTRRLLFNNNVARIGFARDGDALVLRNELRSINPKQQPAGPPDLYTVHEIRFGAPPQTPPPEIEHG